MGGRHPKLGIPFLDLVGRYTDCARVLLGQNLTAIVLFGSVARGEATPESDIDLLVVTRDLPKGAFHRRELLEPVRNHLLPDLEALWEQGIYVDFAEVIKTEAEAQRFHLLYLDLTAEAVLLYDRDAFFAGVLEKLRKQLAELGARRCNLGRITYWDLKPDLKPGEALEL